jgi:hypothetical protein
MHKIFAALILLWEGWQCLHCVFGQVLFANAVIGFLVLLVDRSLAAKVNKEIVSPSYRRTW